MVHAGFILKIGNFPLLFYFFKENLVFLWIIGIFCFLKYVVEEEDGGEIAGSRVHFPLHVGETPSQSSEEQREQPTVPQHI